MPNRPISFEFLADVSNFLRETKKVEVSVDDLADAFVQTTSDSDELERKLAQAMRASKQDVDTLERAVKDVGKASDTVADSAAHDFSRIGDEAADAGREVGDEFKQNLGESLSSGDLSGLLSDTLGGLVGSLSGPIGIAAAGVAGAAALVFNAVKQSWEETQQAISDSASSLWSTTLAQLGDQIGQVTAQVSATVLVQQELSRLWQDSPDNMAKLVEQAELLGINSNDVLPARAGDAQAIGRVNAALRQSEQATDNYLGSTSDVLAAHDDIEQSIFRGSSALDIQKARLDAYNDSIPEVAAAHALITEQIEAWTAGVQRTEQEVETLRRGLEANPFDLEIRVQVDASALRQLFPYGTSSQADVDRVVAGFNPYGPRH
jgi:predicted  nucleic acid-binding Zn-ribbon protein